MIEKTSFSNQNNTSEYVRTKYRYNDKNQKVEEREDFEKGSRYFKSFAYTDSSVTTYAQWNYITVYNKPERDTTIEVHSATGKLRLKKYFSNTPHFEETVYYYYNLGRIKLENTFSKKKEIIRSVKYYYL